MVVTSQRPRNRNGSGADALISKSIYYSLMDESERTHAEDYLEMIIDGEDESGENSNITLNENGEIEYFNYHIDPAVGYYSESNSGGCKHAHRGEFMELRLRNGKTAYVHYSCLYAPKAAMCRKFGFLNIIHGIVLQSLRVQMSQLQDILAEAAALNKKMARLAALYQMFTVLQGIGFSRENDDSGSMMEVGLDVLDEFTKAGLPYPFSHAKRGIIPNIYRVNGIEESYRFIPGNIAEDTASYYYEHVYMVHIDGDKFATKFLFGVSRDAGEGLPDAPDIKFDEIIAMIVGDAELKHQFMTAEGIAKYNTASKDYDEIPNSNKSHLAIDAVGDHPPSASFPRSCVLWVPKYDRAAGKWEFAKSDATDDGKPKQWNAKALEISHTPFSEPADKLTTI
ncbi:MAG: hypothetical protein LBB38_02740, partial [Puniceicoccales bacterium]|nr:hypothetical protein [Puniceicoccales bacterium]